MRGIGRYGSDCRGLYEEREVYEVQARRGAALGGSVRAFFFGEEGVKGGREEMREVEYNL